MGDGQLLLLNFGPGIHGPAETNEQAHCRDTEFTRSLLANLVEYDARNVVSTRELPQIK